MSTGDSSDASGGSTTRDAILAAAVGILHREGAGALTVRSVAAEAGWSTSGVYTWFGGKNGLVEAIFIDGFQRFGAAQRDVRSSRGAAVDLRGYATAYRDWALANPTHYMVMFGKAVPDFEPSSDARAAATETFDQIVAAAREAMREADSDDDPVEVAHHLWAGVHGYVSLELSCMDEAATTPAGREQRFRTGVERLLRGAGL